MALKVRCLACRKVLSPMVPPVLISFAEVLNLPMLSGVPLFPCKCRAIAVRLQNGTIVVSHRADGPHGPKPFEIILVRNGQEVG